MILTTIFLILATLKLQQQLLKEFVPQFFWLCICSLQINPPLIQNIFLRY